MKKRWMSFIAVGFLVSVATAPAQEKAYRLLTDETYLEMETVGSPNISPDGKHILFTRGWVDQMNDRGASNLWITDVEGTRIRELSHGDWRDSSPVWSPDGKQIVFLSDRDGTTQLHVMWLDTREVAQLTHLERAPSGLKWSPDGKTLAFTSLIPDTNPILPVKLPKFPRGAKLAEPALIIDRLSWRRDGRGNTPKGYSHIFIIDGVLGGTPKQITSGDYDHSDPQWSPDGGKIYFTGIRKPDAEYLMRDNEIYVVDLETLDITPLTDHKGTLGSPRVSPSGNHLVYTYGTLYPDADLADIYIMDADGGNRHLLAGDFNNGPSNIVWEPDSSGVTFLMREKGVANLYSCSTSGKVDKLTEGNHYLSAFSIAQNGQVATTVSTFHRPAYLATFTTQEPSQFKELVDVNKDVLGDIQLGDVEEMWFKAPDGLDLQGWLIKPAEFEPGKKYPLMLYIHGGPYSMYSVSFNWAWQNFAANGYAVIYMNPRGSTGYGKDFVKGIWYSYPGKDYDDLMAGVDEAIARGFIDTDNLFVCGGSGGGILTAWIVGHTDRFRAAVSMRPIINWHSFVGTSDVLHWYYWFEKRPWEDPVSHALRSPLHYVANVTTPTMVMTGESDLRTPMPQSEEYYRALKLLKKETLLVRMPDEYHGWRRPSHRLLQQLYLRAWFEKYRVQ